MNLLNKNKTKEMFKKEGIQTNVNALNMLENDIRNIIQSKIKRLQFNNVKRLTERTYWMSKSSNL